MANIKMLGLVGGISWVSSAEYYRLINEGINKRLGGVNAGRIVLFSVNYAEIKAFNERNDTEGPFNLVMTGVRALEAANCEALLLCANTMHMHAERIQSLTNMKLIHIAEETANAIRAKGLSKVALLGTRFTMEQDFFHEKLRAQGIEAIIPEEDDRKFIHYTIFDELGINVFSPESKARYQRIITDLQKQGAQGVILGCTEIPLLIKPGDTEIPQFDTTAIHAEAAIRFALGE